MFDFKNLFYLGNFIWLIEIILTVTYGVVYLDHQDQGIYLATSIILNLIIFALWNIYIHLKEKKILEYYNKQTDAQNVLKKIGNDIINPLSIIQKKYEMLKNKYPYLKKDNLIQQINFNNYLLEQNLNIIITYQKIKNGIPLSNLIERITPRELFIQINNFSKYHQVNNLLEIKYFIGKNVPAYLNTDIKKIQTIYLNYLNNAMKHTPRGIIEVNLTYHKGNIYGEVRNQGNKIPSDIVNKLFQPFQYVNPESRLNGSGLGLFINKCYAESLDGSVGYLHQGNNNVFFFLIPIIKLSPDNREIPDKIEIVIDSPLKILIIYDYLIYAELFNQYLRQLVNNIEIAYANNVEQGVTKLNSDKFDIIFLDYFLDNQTGFDLLAKCDPQTIKLNKIVLLTNIDNKEIIQQAKELGINNFLSKNAKLNVIQEYINNFIK